MKCDETGLDQDDAAFQRWYVGGLPPESDGWVHKSYEDMLDGPPLLAASHCFEMETAWSDGLSAGCRDLSPMELAAA